MTTTSEVENGETALRAGTIRIEWVALAKPYERLRVTDAAAENKLAASLAHEGQRCAALVVSGRDERAPYVLIDGYRRARALHRLGRDAIVAMVIGLEEAEALAYLHQQETSRRRSAVEDGWLVRELVETHGKSLADVSLALGRTRSWTSRRLGLVRSLPVEVEQAVRLGTVPPHAAMKSLLPLARANAEACVKLVVGLGREAVTTRQVALLYDAWRKGDAEQRARIVDSPRLLLAASEAVAPGEPSTTTRKDEAGHLAKDLGAASSLVWRAKSTLERALVVDAGVRRDDFVARAFRRVTDAYAALARRMDDGGMRAHAPH